MNNISDKVDKIKTLSKKIRKKILYTSLHAGQNSSHFGGSLSNVEIVATLFSEYLNIDKNDLLSEKRNRFILSKGHGCLAYYAALNEFGFFKTDTLEEFEKNESNLLGHPVMNRKIGIEFSTGSLGMGLGLGIGVAISMLKKKLSNKIYVLLGDGECNEGSVWEAAMAASNFNLQNLCALIDHNKFQQTGSNNEIMYMGDLKSKWESFEWNVLKIDGHNISELIHALEKDFFNNKPKMIIANTIKGKGFTFSENNNEWHHQILTQKKYDEAISEIENK